MKQQKIDIRHSFKKFILNKVFVGLNPSVDEMGNNNCLVITSVNSFRSFYLLKRLSVVQIKKCIMIMMQAILEVYCLTNFILALDSDFEDC